MSMTIYNRARRQMARQMMCQQQNERAAHTVTKPSHSLKPILEITFCPSSLLNTSQPPKSSKLTAAAMQLPATTRARTAQQLFAQPMPHSCSQGVLGATAFLHHYCHVTVTNHQQTSSRLASSMQHNVPFPVHLRSEPSAHCAPDDTYRHCALVRCHLLSRIPAKEHNYWKKCMAYSATISTRHS
jgi:hypothetical protein